MDPKHGDEILERDAEARWRADGKRNGWLLPQKVWWKWPLYWPVIRHVRWAWHAWRAERQARAFASVGVGLGHLNPYDEWVLWAVLKGKC
jgi:hypothetical protein